MTTIFIKRNPFTGEMQLERDGKMIPQVAKLSCLRNRFIQQAFSLYEDIQDEYNDDELTVSLCTSSFEVFLFSAISGQGSIFQVVRQDFLVNTALQERLSKLTSLLSKYCPNEQLIAPLAIQVFCPDEAVFNAFKEKLEQDYPELKQIGISIEKSKNRSSVNLVQNEEEIDSSSGLFSAPPGAGFKTVFVLSDEGKIRLDNDTVYWPLTSKERFEIVKSYLERFYVFDYAKRLIQSFPKDKLSEEDRFLLETLDKVDEAILISLPREIEIGTTSIAVAKTFSGDPCPELEVESTYPEIIVAEVGDAPGKIVLHAMSVGDSEIKIKRAGDYTPFYQDKVTVINYDYATSVAMLVNGNSVRNHVFTPGDSAQISLKYTPADSPKTKEDVQNGKWSVSDPQVLAFDPKTSVVSAKKPGFAKLKIALTRVSAEIPFVVKPKLSDFSISLLNPPSGNEQEIRYSEKNKGEPEFIKLIIGSELKFSYSLIPEDCLPATAVVECSQGLEIKQAPDQTHFSIVAKRISRNETLRIRVPGCQRVILISIEVIPHPGTSDTSSRIPTYIGISVAGAVILWLLVLMGVKIGVFIGIVGVLVLLLDFVVRKKIQEDEKGSDEDKEKATKYVMILIGVAVLALLVSMIPSCDGRRSSYSSKTPSKDPFVQSDSSARIKVSNIEKELAPVTKNVSDYDNGMIQKVWNGWPSYDKWNYDFFTSSDYLGETVDTGSLAFGERSFRLFSPEIILLSRNLRSYANDKSVISCHALLKILKSDEYQFIISHYDIPAHWSCGGYVIYIDGVELVFMKSDGYNTDNNRVYTAKAKLAEGYHDFLFAYEVNWKEPQASNTTISLRASQASGSYELTVSDMYIPKSKLPKENTVVPSELTAIANIPASYQKEIKQVENEITRINKSLATQQRSLSNAEAQMQKSKTPERISSKVKSLQENVASLEKSLQLQQEKRNRLYRQLNRD